MPRRFARTAQRITWRKNAASALISGVVNACAKVWEDTKLRLSTATGATSRFVEIVAIRCHRSATVDTGGVHQIQSTLISTDVTTQTAMRTKTRGPAHAAAMNVRNAEYGSCPPSLTMIINSINDNSIL